MRTHFWPFTGVLRKFWRGVTRKVGTTADDTDVTDGFLYWRLTHTPYNWMLDSTRQVQQPRDALPFCIRVIRAIRGESYFRGAFTAAFPRRVFGKRDQRAKGPRSGRSLKAPV